VRKGKWTAMAVLGGLGRGTYVVIVWGMELLSVLPSRLWYEWLCVTLGDRLSWKAGVPGKGRY
jgi:hypothetical protein